MLARDSSSRMVGIYIPNYNLDGPELNADPPFWVLSNPTPTIQENSTLAEGGPFSSSETTFAKISKSLLKYLHRT